MLNRTVSVACSVDVSVLELYEGMGTQNNCHSYIEFLKVFLNTTSDETRSKEGTKLLLLFTLEAPCQQPLLETHAKKQQIDLANHTRTTQIDTIGMRNSQKRRSRSAGGLGCRHSEMDPYAWVRSECHHNDIRLRWGYLTRDGGVSR